MLMINFSHDRTRLVIDASSRTRSSTELGSREVVMLYDGAGLGREQIKYIRWFRIHRFKYVLCIEYVLVLRSSSQS
ncbi:hypothetical protein TNCV_1242501 [Trichonephila clavipes]|nr:hypothetical protein TNCV_1242501 [Trichonephila clavipes]